MKQFLFSRKAIPFVLILTVLTGLLISGAFYRAVPLFCRDPLSYEDLLQTYQASDALLFDRNGRVIHELRVNPEIRRLGWVRLEEMSPPLLQSVIESEDRRFYLHHGVDWKAVAHSAIQNLLRSSTRGASTITMQVAALTDDRLLRKKGERTLTQKWHQMLQAITMERAWTKDRILEAYLNRVSFKGEIQGIAAASLGLFDKMPSGLNDAESVILASLIRSPNASFEDVIMRSCRLGDSLSYAVPEKVIRETGMKIFSTPYRIRPRMAMAPVAARQLLKTGSHVTSTLEGNLQHYASESLKRQVAGLKDQNVHDGAVLVLENQTGDILAYVGNAGGMSGSGHVDGVRALRQAGSTLKPFLYELALERKILTAASVLMDSPINISTGTGIYAPHNYDENYKGAVSVRTCLSASLNIPAIRTILLAGVEAFGSRLQDLGFSHLNLGEFYGPSLALGSADVSLFELTHAYRILASKGVWSSVPSLLPKSPSSPDKPAPHQIMDEKAVFIISDILSDRGARSLTFGLENPLCTRFWTAVKTGTSKDMRDNWCIGYSKTYTVGVWVGNFNGAPMWNVSGMSGAAPVWLETMNYLHRDIPSLPPEPPDGVVETAITYSDGSEPDRSEWFISGTETRFVKPDHTAMGNARINYPADGTLLTLDPDIPEDRQMVFFSASPKRPDWKWVLNDQLMARENSLVRWKPKAGHYTLMLMDASDAVLDSVSFEVRGSMP